MFIKKDIVKSSSLRDDNDKKRFFLSSKQKDIVIIPKNKNNNNIKNLNKFDIKHNDKSYENIKNIVLSSDAKLEKSKK